MAEQRQLEEIAVANFDLLGPNDDLYEVNLEDELTEEHREAVQNMFNEITEKELGEKADSMDDFEPDVSTSRHVNCSSADLDNYSDANSKDTTKKQTKWAVSIFLDWLRERRKDTNFENLPDTILAEILRQFFGEVRNKQGKPYSKSGLVNIRSGLNRYLQGPPHNRIINLMHNDCFQNANKVFTGVLWVNKQNGLDVRKPKVAISHQDVQKLHDTYFMPGLAKGDTEVLLHKVFFDMVYYMGRRAKEGLRELQKDSFEYLKTPDGKTYLQIKHNEVTKKNQGDNMASRYSRIHDNKNIIVEQPGDPMCPISSFERYTSLLNPKINDFFQRPSKNKTKYDAMPLGIHYLGALMKHICRIANLSRVHTNHEIRKTTGTAMRKGGIPTQEIAEHLGHKDIQSVQYYLEAPTIEDKQRHAEALAKYTKNKESNPDENDPPQPAVPALPHPVKENVTPQNAVIPFQPNFDENIQQNLVIAANTQQIPVVIPSAPNALPSTSNSQVVNNQLRTAPVMFQGATFQNCTINLQVPQ